MARHTGPKWRLSRREGIDLFYRAGSKYQKDARVNQPPGVHGPKQFRSKSSGYNLQLREKQKAKRTYGVLERQFRHYYEEAIKSKSNTGEIMLQLLERRLDNIIYRLGLAKTRFQARQTVSHGHVTVNGKRVNIPSYQVKALDLIGLDSKASKFGFVTENLEQKYPIPDWLELKATIGKVLHLPSQSDIESDIKFNLIIEYYSR
jgi:small subunit ribosomal protein S4